jgi:hypothetical protein
MTDDIYIAFFVLAPSLALTVALLTLGWRNLRRQ